MSAIALAISLAHGALHLTFTTPGAGDYALLCGDGRGNWRVVASGANAVSVHVAHTEAAQQPCALYRVEWRPAASR